MRYVRGITIAAIAILLGLFLAAYRPWRSGANHGETGGSNVAQSDKSQASGAQGVQQPVQGGNQSTEKVQQPAKEVKQQAAATQGAKRQAKSAKRPTVKMRRAVEQESADCECQDVETQGVEQVVIDVIEPTEYYEEETTISVEPRSQTEAMKYTYYWPTTQTVNITVPESQECPTPYHEVWVEFPDQ